ncbi:MAG: hypothetical protein RL153_897, partial [Verrucomicrobiota bacterium]
PFFPMANTNGIPFDAAFALGSTLHASWSLPADAAVNPFKHRYHPDHDNLDATFRTYREEAYAVRRTVRLIVPSVQGSGTKVGSGQDQVEGVYEETVQGLHRNAITARGTFSIKRIVPTGTLDPVNP